MKILTFDIEDWFHILDNPSTKNISDWKKFDTRIYRNMDIIHEICSKSNTKSTFFILGWIAEKYPEIVKKISELGYDIAFSSNKSSKDSASIEAKRKEILSQAYGQLAKQLGGTLEVNFDKASAEWTIKIGNKTISSLFDDRSNKASLDNIILEDYNEFLK